MRSSFPNTHCPVCGMAFTTGEYVFTPIDADGPAKHYRCAYNQQDVSDLIREVSEHGEQLATMKIAGVGYG